MTDPVQTGPARAWRGWLLWALLAAGCVVAPPRAVSLPARHSVRSDHLVVLSDFRLPKEHPLIEDLVRLRRQVSETLELPPPSVDVVVYLFDSELEFTQYLNAAYPGLPQRRAYFVGTPRELAVYTFWGDRIQEDLRHEYTHGLLHAAHKSVPLWIDEGLAEYFEVPGPAPGTVNAEYAARLATALSNGWLPDIERLERLERFEQMQRTDYQEAWAWVHFLLHGTPETREILLGYLRDLRTDSNPAPLSQRLRREQPHFQARFLNYLASLPTARLMAAAPGM